MKFWEKHSEEMRKARLLQASAIIYAELGPAFTSIREDHHITEAVRKAIRLENETEIQLALQSKGENERR